MKYWIEVDDVLLQSKSVLSLAAKAIAPQSKILEIGPSYGHFSKYLKTVLNCDITAIEIQEDARSDLEKYCSRVIIGNVENLDFQHCFNGETFDYIVLMDVLEHLVNPKEVIKNLKKFTNSQSELIVSIPNVAHNAVLYKLFQDDFEYSDAGLLDKTHLRFFSINNLKPLFADTGFSISKLEFIKLNFTDTEIRVDQSKIPTSLKHALDGHLLGDIYQFFIIASSGAIEGEAWVPATLHLEDPYDAKCREINALYNSFSWRLTKPLRYGGRLIRKWFSWGGNLF